VPVGNPAPPRPFRFDADTSPMMSARLFASAAARPEPGSIVSKVRGVFRLSLGCISASSPYACAACVACAPNTLRHSSMIRCACSAVTRV